MDEPQTLRIKLSPNLKEWLREQARRNCRSMNTEIAFMLEFARLKQTEAAAGEASRA